MMGPDGNIRRTLFIDMEDTLITSEWDKEHGERYVKRPGVDKMLTYLSAMYEIVLVCNMDYAFAFEIINSIDPKHICSAYLFNDSMKLRNGIRVKDISVFDRDPKRVIVVDDNIEANEHRENVLVVKPFKNARRVRDTTLLDLIPVLEGGY